MLGAFTGAFTAIWAELVYIYAMRPPATPAHAGRAGDGKIDSAERAHINIITHGLRFGMTLLLLASLALIVIAYVLNVVMQPALTASYWIFMTLALLIIGLSWALARHYLSFSLGSAATLSAWWLLAYATLGQLPISFGAAIALYIVLTAVLFVVLHSIRLLAQKIK
jgi:hypothetical protein